MLELKGYLIYMAKLPIKPEMKQCLSCSIEKPIIQFYKDKSCKDGRVRKCIACYETIRLNKKLADPESHLIKTQTFWLKHRYGITLKDYNDLLAEQKGACAICGRLDSGKSTNKAFCVDHCHTTGKVRGLLCMPCNRSLGQFQDSIDILEKAVYYLKKAKEN